MLLAIPNSSRRLRRLRRYLAAKPLSFWIMTWFLFELVVLTGLQFLPRPGLVLGVALEELTSVIEKFVVAWQTLFGHPIRAFGVVSLLLLILLAVAPAKNHFSEWRIIRISICL